MTGRLLPFALFSMPAAAAEASLAGAALQTFGGLLVVVAAIVGAAYFARRLAPGRLGRTPLMKPIASLALGARERVVVVEMGAQWLVLGVTPTSVSLLHVTPKGELPAAPAEPAPFAAWLQKAKRGDV